MREQLCYTGLQGVNACSAEHPEQKETVYSDSFALDSIVNPFQDGCHS